MIKQSSKSQSVKISSILFLIIFVTGCGFWTNFKTYFNTYYNAKKLFEAAEQKVIDSRDELFYFDENASNQNVSKDFEAVIEKTSSILQHSKESSYVPEALLMTGKSFYYQQNFSRALRKFNELATLTHSELLLENKLWIAKANLQLREFNKGLKILDEVISEASDKEENETLTEAYKTKIGYLIYIEDYTQASAEIDEFFKVDIDDELKAEVLFEMGRLYKLSEDYESAQNAFARVDDYSPTFEIDFNSKFEVAKLEGELGNIDQSLESLKNLRNEDKFSDSFGDIDLEIGKIYYDREEIEEALNIFTEVDTTYLKTESAGIAGFYRAEILENNFNDYDSALVFYKKVAGSLAPTDFRTIARNKTTLLNKYINTHKELGKLEKQFLYLTDEGSFLQDSLDYIFKVKQDSIKYAEENPASPSPLAKGNRNAPKTTYKAPVRPKLTIDSVHALNSKQYFELANLLFSEFDDPDSAFFYYTLSLEEDDENPNKAQTYYALGNYYLIKEEKIKADSMFTIVYNEFEFDPIRNEAAKQIGKPLYDFDKDPVEDEYVIAESIYDSLQYDKAISSLFNIYEEHPKSIYASKSLYTIGYILENELNMPDSAASIYNTLSTEYKTSEYAKAISIKLSGHKQEQARIEAAIKAKQDSINTIEQSRIDSVKQLESVLNDELAGSDSLNYPVEPIDTSIVDSIKTNVNIRKNEVFDEAESLRKETLNKIQDRESKLKALKEELEPKIPPKKDSLESTINKAINVKEK